MNSYENSTRRELSKAFVVLVPMAYSCKVKNKAILLNILLHNAWSFISYVQFLKLFLNFSRSVFHC